jgi:hypothetical protein
VSRGVAGELRLRELEVRADISPCEPGACIVAKGRGRRFLAGQRLAGFSRADRQPKSACFFYSPVNQRGLCAAPTVGGKGCIDAELGNAALHECGPGGNRGAAVIGEIQVPSRPAE